MSCRKSGAVIYERQIYDEINRILFDLDAVSHIDVANGTPLMTVHKYCLAMQMRMLSGMEGSSAFQRNTLEFIYILWGFSGDKVMRPVV